MQILPHLSFFFPLFYSSFPFSFLKKINLLPAVDAVVDERPVVTATQQKHGGKNEKEKNENDGHLKIGCDQTNSQRR